MIFLRTFLSTKMVSSTAGSTGILILRVGIALMMLSHGMSKLWNFSDASASFIDPIGLGSGFALTLVIFAEVFCSVAILVGLLTRAAVLPLIINMLVAVFVAHGGDGFAAKELGMLYLIPYCVLLFTGPGKFSVDRFIWK